MNIGNMTEKDILAQLNQSKVYGIYDDMQGWLAIQLMPNDELAKRCFKERCATLPDTTVNCLHLYDLGSQCDFHRDMELFVGDDYE